MPGHSIFPAGDKDTTISTVNLSETLIDFARGNRSDAAKYGADAAQYLSDRAEQDLVQAVSQAFYGVLQAQKIKQVVEDSIAAVQLQVRDAQAFLTQGLVASTDVLSAQVRLAQRQQELIQAETNLQVARASLNRLLGWDVSGPLALQDVVTLIQWQGSYPDLLKTAEDNRADLKALKLQIESARADLRATQADYLPRVSVFAQHDTNTTSLLAYNEWNTVGVAVSMNLFNGFSTSAQVERKQKELLEAQDQYQERHDNISLEVKQAFLFAQQSLDQVAVAGKTVDLAKDTLRIQRDRYAQGLVTTTDVLNADDDAARARSNYFQALYAFYAALARLDNVTGKSPATSAQP